MGNQIIFTLNARENVMLEVIKDYFNLNEKAIHKEIQNLHKTTIKILQSKNIEYSKLKSALVPQKKKKEAAFIFDSQCINSSWYGLEIAKHILPLYNKESTHSILCGDLIGKNQNLICKILQESLILARPYVFTHGTALYSVYINNLTKSMLEMFHNELKKIDSYIGFIPTTFSSPAKHYLSFILVNSYLKHKDHIILRHEDDVSNDKNINTLGYPFYDFGYKVISLQDCYFSLFLAYKIERPVFPNYEIDTKMCLNAITYNILPLNKLTIEIEESKYNYLKQNKNIKLKKNELIKLIKRKINDNYIYNMQFLSEHNIIKFNIMIEIPGEKHPIKMLTALEFNSSRKILRLLTFY